MKNDYDAAIVGGGPAGCTAAILLAQAGWSVALIEQNPFPRRKVCGECIAATNLSIFDALGIGAQFDSLAGPALKSVALYAGKSVFTAPLPQLDRSPHPWGRALGREHLDTLLLQRACALGVDVWQPWQVKHVEKSSGRGKTCHLVSRESNETATLSARVLIAANGSWEPDPFTERIERRPRRDSDLFAFKATYAHAKLPPHLLPILAFAGGYGGMVLGDHGQVTLAFCVRRDTLRRARERGNETSAALAAAAHVLRSCAGAGDALSGAELLYPWLSVGPIRPGMRLPSRRDGAFAIGNAAGEAHPILGEGISMAVQSAWMLCGLLISHEAVLRRGGEAKDILKTYANLWQREFSGRIRTAAVFAHMAMRAPLARPLHPLMDRWPGLLTLGARMGAKVRQSKAFSLDLPGEGIS